MNKQFLDGLDFGFVRSTDTGLIFKNHTHSQASMEELLFVLIGLGSYSRWGIGDALMEGMDVHGEAFAQILNARNIKFVTAQKYLWVCRRFSGEFRSWRLPETTLSFTHHELLAGLLSKTPEAIRFAMDLQKRAVAENLSCEETEAEIQNYMGIDPDEDLDNGEDDISLSTRPPAERLEDLRDKLEELLNDAPEDWSHELPLLRSIVADMDKILNSISNRAGGSDGFLETDE